MPRDPGANRRPSRRPFPIQGWTASPGRDDRGRAGTDFLAEIGRRMVDPGRVVLAGQPGHALMAVGRGAVSTEGRQAFAAILETTPRRQFATFAAGCLRALLRLPDIREGLDLVAEVRRRAKLIHSVISRSAPKAADRARGCHLPHAGRGSR